MFRQQERACAGIRGPEGEEVGAKLEYGPDDP